jgi:deoxyadenosine/deoxycytidine kinase
VSAPAAGERVAPPSARFIAVEGPIGVGKTSLARRLATTWHTELLLEDAAENPFLPKFYEDPRRYALATQLHFLFHRTRELQARNQADLFAPRLTADFLFEKDRLFARVALDDDEYALYRDIYQRVAQSLPGPSLVVYLQASVPTLRKRIARRGIAYEQRIEAGYLERLCAEYVDFFHRYDEAPLLIVNAEEFNPVEVDAHFEMLLAEIERGVVGRRYFNPGLR